MKKFLPIVLAMVVFAVALALNRPEPQVAVVVAAADLPEGRVLAESDLATKEMPKSLAPDGAVSEVQSLVGQRLRVARSAGDPILPAHLGGEVLELRPNERAVALQVSAAQGLAGLLKPGDRVGLTVIVNSGQQTFAKYLVGGLRVLWVDPAFKRDSGMVPQTTPSGGGLFGGGSPAAAADVEGAARGLVVLAIPTDMKVVPYAFAAGFGAENIEQPLYLLDVLPALTTQGAQFGLVLEPEKAQEAQTSGLALQSLVITPGPTMTPTPTGQAAAVEVQGTPEPTKKP
ncbi:Flp pilus assembly protein CpaB [Thermanaerothrix sp. 4228-RoL]|uniref:Flp pilus assembly protein CpaB n=1 Tax=Thermanaerothrix solaris TaxID=3058434 RepID=A0ABU3NRJ0_9CHLR|nr:Flp pilus assembly protein CpaB [Thermanaerothrix sp. 4228-RoL]MDT8899458.1 Flp pilus assembly protein CpaB [Thermanaerothrix sp. 4228-RoL]